MKTDLFILGSGPGGYRAAEYAAKNGLKVVIAESAQAGGTCLNCGCIPTKAFCHDAELAELGLPVDFAKVVERKQQIVEQLRSGVETLMQMPGITFVHGHAHFIDNNTVEVVSTSRPSESEEWREPETTVQQFKADNIIIATGSRTKILPIPGITGPHCVTSTELLDIQEVPKRLCIIGAGVIGMEFASVFASFGSEVTVVEYLKECLPALDGDIAKRLRKQLEKRGVKFYLGAGVKQVDGQKVTFERKGKEEQVEADVILVATGRTPNIENLNLDKAGIVYDRSGIKVNPDTFEVEKNNPTTSNSSRIFAIGDVNGRQLLAHAATMQGFRAVNTILNRRDNIQFDIMPAAVFTNPEAASVGPTEDMLKTEGCEYTCHKGYYRANGKALAINATDGFVKLFTDADDRMIGCHILGAHAADLVQEISALMNCDTKLSRLRDIVHIHPTLSEILPEIS